MIDAAIGESQTEDVWMTGERETGPFDRRVFLRRAAASLPIAGAVLAGPRGRVAVAGRKERAMPTVREVIRVGRSQATMEGAGVRLWRAFGRADASLDPFLLLDHFGSDDPADYAAGFPWHPHRGMETITYMLEGRVAHGDSLGNRGVIGPGDVQWMTAGSGIVHEEMPQVAARLAGFQLWANLPAAKKMMAPRYQEVAAVSIPVAEPAEGVEVRVICGELAGVLGPVRDIVSEPRYLDVTLAPGAAFSAPVAAGHNAFAYVFRGAARFGAGGSAPALDAHHLAVFGPEGDELRAAGGAAGARFLLVSGRPLGEPVAWRGPIVMNTEAELDQAFSEYRAGTFVRRR